MKIRSAQNARNILISRKKNILILFERILGNFPWAGNK